MLWRGVEDDGLGAAELVAAVEVEAFGDDEVRDLAVEEGRPRSRNFRVGRVSVAMPESVRYFEEKEESGRTRRWRRIRSR